MGTRLAQVARNKGVGLSLSNGLLTITLLREGIFRPLVNIGKLLKSLTKQAESTWMKELELRHSKDTNKVPAPLFGISWGDAGMVSLYRKQENAFLRSRYLSDYDLKILIGLRLLLWPTKVRDQVSSKNRISGRCRCGAIQTTTHLLNLASSNEGHSPEMRSAPIVRHDTWVTTIATAVHESKSGWEIIRGQGVEGSEMFRVFNNSVTSALLRKTLQPSRDKRSHWKPDLILGLKTRSTIKILILDLCGGNPERLFVENDLFKHLQKMKPENHTDFTFEGELTTTGVSTLAKLKGVSVTELETTLQTFTTFKTVRYAQRYQPFKELLDKLLSQDPELKELKKKINVHAVPIGVTGTIPSFTVTLLKSVLDRKQVPRVLKELRNTSWSFAVKIYKAWRKEA